jgi:single-stranded DNA-binding protein
MNIAVIQGRLSSAPVERSLPSGSRVVTLEVSTRRAGERADTVPVAWNDAPAGTTELQPGIGVLVIGRVRRRFFRVAGGFTQSRTEVVAEKVVPLGHTKRVRAALARVADDLADQARPK